MQASLSYSVKAYLRNQASLTGGTAEMTRWVTALAALPEDWRSVPSTHTVAPSSISAVPGVQSFLLASRAPGTHAHAGKMLTQ